MNATAGARKLFYFLLLSSLLFSCTQTKKISADRLAAWAQQVNTAGLSNLYKVDEHVFRSEQPNHKEMLGLKTMGVSTILNLRHVRNDDHKARRIKLKLEHVRINTWKISYDELVSATAILMKTHEPILVHCLHGSDRTGAVIAGYRIIKFNWTKEEAIKEMIEGGYGFHEKTFPNIVRLLTSMNVEKFKMDVAKSMEGSTSQY